MDKSRIDFFKHNWTSVVWRGEGRGSVWVKKKEFLSTNGGSGVRGVRVELPWIRALVTRGHSYVTLIISHLLTNGSIIEP